MRLPLFRRGTYANVVATLALVVAMSGTAYAVVITSADIQDGTIQSVDIADSGVKAADINAGAVQAPEIAGNAVNGSRVADGSIGVADLAPAARSKVWSRWVSNVSVATTLTTVADTAAVPPGTYLVEASASMSQANDATTDLVLCYLRKDVNTFMDIVYAGTGTTGYMRPTVHLERVATVAPGTTSTFGLACLGQAPGTKADFARVTVLRVDEAAGDTF